MVEVERVVERHRVGIHEVTVVETVEDEDCWYHLVVDGVPREGLLAVPPTAGELADAVVPGRDARPDAVTRDRTG